MKKVIVSLVAPYLDGKEISNFATALFATKQNGVYGRWSEASGETKHGRLKADHLAKLKI